MIYFSSVNSACSSRPKSAISETNITREKKTENWNGKLENGNPYTFQGAKVFNNFSLENFKERTQIKQALTQNKQTIEA